MLSKKDSETCDAKGDSDTISMKRVWNQYNKGSPYLDQFGEEVLYEWHQYNGDLSWLDRDLESVSGWTCVRFLRARIENAPSFSCQYWVRCTQILGSFLSRRRSFWLDVNALWYSIVWNQLQHLNHGPMGQCDSKIRQKPCAQTWELKMHQSSHASIECDVLRFWARFLSRQRSFSLNVNALWYSIIWNQLWHLNHGPMGQRDSKKHQKPCAETWEWGLSDDDLTCTQRYGPLPNWIPKDPETSVHTLY